MKFGNGVDLDNNRIVNVADPSGATDAANKQYVDAFVRGLSWKDSVRAATTTNGTLASAYANGSSVDGVTLATGDRILLKDQTAGEENGIYTVNASGAPTRAVDADSAAELVGATVTVTEGTVNADRVYRLVTDSVTLETTSLSWTQLGGAGTSYTAGAGLAESPAGTFNVTNTDGSITVGADTVSLASQVAGAGLTLTSGVLDVVGDSSITVGADSLGLAAGVAGDGLTLTSGVLDVVGGTGITASAGDIAIDTSVVARKYSTSVGNGSLTSIAVTHNLGTKDVVVQLRQNSDDAAIITDWVATDTNTVTLSFATAPASSAIRVTVIG